MGTNTCLIKDSWNTSALSEVFSNLVPLRIPRSESVSVWDMYLEPLVPLEIS